LTSSGEKGLGWPDVQMSVNFSQIGLRGPATVRDLWLKKKSQDTFLACAARHGVVLVKIQGK
jgi:hypothetical protein